MNTERYDNIEYDESWQTTSSVRAKPARREPPGRERIQREAYRENSPYDESTDEYDNENYFEPEQENKIRKVKVKQPLGGTQRIIKLQLIICILAAIAFFAIKGLAPDLYVQLQSWYEENINSSIIITQTGSFF
ncbi:MAG: hypothetical protein ACI4I4_00935 [Acutalibacteraceae bacterium]